MLVTQPFPGNVEPSVGAANVVQTGSPGRDSHILIVDDDPDAREIFRYTLRSMGISTQEAYNGVEALEHIKVRRPDLIVLDLMMPLMDGFQVLTHLRSDPITRLIPIIVITGMREGREMLHLPGVARVLVKGSFTISQIRSVISELMAVAGSSIAV
jgi:CheY-like chemotaxis protein